MKWKLLLQMFANSKTNSSTDSTSGSTSTTNEHTSTQGGSTSTTTGHSETQSHTTSEQHSKGGSESLSNGKSWASGDIEANTQAHRDQYNKDYTEGQKVADTYQRLQDTLSGKPTFQSQYEDRLNQLYESIMNQDKFSYNFNADSMYQLYKDQYTQQGKTAMQDAMGQAAALTGGYGSSYAQSVGQQTYQNYLQDLNNMIPQLRNQAYQEYQAEQQRLMDQYSLTSDAYNREYGQYRDDVSDWQADRSFNYGAYQDERNFDYNQFANERNYWNSEYWNEKNSAQSNTQATSESNWNDTYGKSDTYSSTDYSETTNTSSWSNTDSTSTTNSSAWSKSNTSSNTVSDAGGSSGSSSKSASAGKTGGNATSNFVPFNITKGDYLFNKSSDQIGQMASALGNAAKESDDAYRNVANNMQKQFGLSDAEIGYLTQQAGIKAPTNSYQNGFDNLGNMANTVPTTYSNYAQKAEATEQQPGESKDQYLERLKKMLLSTASATVPLGIY